MRESVLETSVGLLDCIQKVYECELAHLCASTLGVGEQEIAVNDDARL